MVRLPTSQTPPRGYNLARANSRLIQSQSAPEAKAATSEPTTSVQSAASSVRPPRFLVGGEFQNGDHDERQREGHLPAVGRLRSCASKTCHRVRHRAADHPCHYRIPAGAAVVRAVAGRTRPIGDAGRRRRSCLETEEAVGATTEKVPMSSLRRVFLEQRSAQEPHSNPHRRAAIRLRARRLRQNVHPKRGTHPPPANPHRPATFPLPRLSEAFRPQRSPQEARKNPPENGRSRSAILPESVLVIVEGDEHSNKEAAAFLQKSAPKTSAHHGRPPSTVHRQRFTVHGPRRKNRYFVNTNFPDGK